jgi:hypothetical protein
MCEVGADPGLEPYGIHTIDPMPDHQEFRNMPVDHSPRTLCSNRPMCKIPRSQAVAGHDGTQPVEERSRQSCRNITHNTISPPSTRHPDLAFACVVRGDAAVTSVFVRLTNALAAFDEGLRAGGAGGAPFLPGSTLRGGAVTSASSTAPGAASAQAATAKVGCDGFDETGLHVDPGLQRRTGEDGSRWLCPAADTSGEHSCQCDGQKQSPNGDLIGSHDGFPFACWRSRQTIFCALRCRHCRDRPDRASRSRHSRPCTARRSLPCFSMSHCPAPPAAGTAGRARSCRRS